MEIRDIKDVWLDYIFIRYTKRSWRDFDRHIARLLGCGEYEVLEYLQSHSTGLILQRIEERLTARYPLRYAWKNNCVRAALYNRRCRIIARGAFNTVLIEFADNGLLVTTSGNALRKEK